MTNGTYDYVDNSEVETEVISVENEEHTNVENDDTNIEGTEDDTNFFFNK